MQQFITQNSEIILRLVTAACLGLVIGLERVLVHKEAGMKTHALVAMGAAVFVLASEALIQEYSHLPGLNPTMIPAQIVLGIGFLGAGSIMLQDSKLRGLTTATGLWVVAGIGMSAGLGFYGLAFIATTLAILILTLVNIFEKPIRRMSGDKENY
jgi:putative Mg2+ transporter-C (MgtC) family protein